MLRRLAVSSMYALNVFTSYLLMLAVMTYSIGERLRPFPCLCTALQIHPRGMAQDGSLRSSAAWPCHGKGSELVTN